MPQEQRVESEGGNEPKASQRSDADHFRTIQSLRPDLSESEIRQFVHDHFADEGHVYQLTHSDEWHSSWGGWRRRNPNLVPRLSGAKLYNQHLQDVALSHARLGSANFRHSDLYNADLSHAYSRHADFRNARLRKAKLIGGDFECANFNDCDCAEADMRGANLFGVSFFNSNLSEADLRGSNVDGSGFSGANLTRSNLSGLDLRGVGLENCILVGTDLTAANLSGARVYGISAWDVKLDGAIQNNLIVTPHDQPEISVDNLEVAQFMYLILNNKKIRYVIDTITSKIVLILGRFTPDRKVILDAIRDELRKSNYTPVLFDFDKPFNRDITETVSTLAHMARFVIADLSDPKSIPHELAHVAPLLPSVPIMPLIMRPQKEYAMFEHFFGFRHVLKPFRYRDESHLLSALEERVIAPAEKLALRVAGNRTRR